MLKLKYLCATSLLLLLNTLSHAQWKPYQSEIVIDDQIYSLATDQDNQDPINFYFPEYSTYLEYGQLNQAYRFSLISSKSGVLKGPNNKNAVLIFDKKIASKYSFKGDTTSIGLRVFVKNIESFTIKYYVASKNFWFTKTFDIVKQGFQNPQEDYISHWEVKSNPPAIIDRSGDCIQISCKLVNPNEPFDFITGVLRIHNYLREEKPIRHDFFKNISAIDQNYSTGKYSIMNNSVEYIQHPVYGIGTHFIPGTIIIKKADIYNKTPEVSLLKSLIFKSLQYYPFYNERHLNKENILSEVKKMFLKYPSAKNYCDLQKALSQYISSTFDDPHFSFDLSSECEIHTNVPVTKQAPVRIYEIKGKFFVVGIFDQLYTELKLGTEITAIDSKPINMVMDSIAMQSFGRPFKELSVYKKNTITPSCLNRASTDSCILEYKDSLSHSQKIKLVYNRSLKIPDSFKSKPFLVNSIDSVGYIKLVNWSAEYIMEIFNAWNKLSQDKAIIIDLRGNGGGELNPALQLISLFVSKPIHYLDLLNINGVTDSLILKPNDRYKFNDKKKIFIVTDYSTACTSESFIKAMKYSYANCTVIASSWTFGTFSFKYTLNLPSGATLNTNSLYGRFIYNKPEDQIEYKGLKPDILIDINKVEELKPYEDKVLKRAYQLASAEK